MDSTQQIVDLNTGEVLGPDRYKHVCWLDSPLMDWVRRWMEVEFGQEVRL